MTLPNPTIDTRTDEEKAAETLLLVRIYLRGEVAGSTERIHVLARLLDAETRAMYGNSFEQCTNDARNTAFQALLLRAARPPRSPAVH